MYDVLAGKENMEHSYLMSKSRALEAFPMLKSDGLVGALVYYDGGLYDVLPSNAVPTIHSQVNTTTRA
jgi:glycerol-3-phosphate dehydrogenase